MSFFINCCIVKQQIGSYLQVVLAVMLDEYCLMQIKEALSNCMNYMTNCMTHKANVQYRVNNLYGRI